MSFQNYLAQARAPLAKPVPDMRRFIVGKDKIIMQMCMDINDLHSSNKAGSAETLRKLGWAQEQIDLHVIDATQEYLSRKRAERAARRGSEPATFFADTSGGLK